MPIRDRMLTMLRRTVSSVVLAGLVMLGLPPAGTSAAGLALQVVGTGFDQPVFVTHAADSRLFVVEQRGRIKIIHPNSSVTTFLNLSSIVSQTGSERGLLGLAFHPNYASNGLLYVNYTRASDGDTVIAEYRRSGANPDVADPTSARMVLTIAQPYSNHNGGWIAFKGPNLYIATGDGGSGGDPANHAQSKQSLLGKILRINPLDPDGNGARRYSIPSKNPYVGRSGKDEIWSRGLRNPWRCSFDRVTAKLWCADVGQSRYEEVNRSRTGKGVNYGWRLLEGRHLYPSGALCTTNCKTRPIAEYAHTAFGGGNCAVTGGYVSRRSGAGLYGKYVFGDYCSGRVWVIGSNRKAGKALPSPVADTNYLISSFGEGSDGRLYLVDLGGTILRLSDS